METNVTCGATETSMTLVFTIKEIHPHQRSTRVSTPNESQTTCTTPLRPPDPLHPLVLCTPSWQEAPPIFPLHHLTHGRKCFLDPSCLPVVLTGIINQNTRCVRQTLKKDSLIQLEYCSGQSYTGSSGYRLTSRNLSIESYGSSVL